jgi:hypothetical protein
VGVVCQSIDRVDDFWSIPGAAEVVQGDFGVLNHIVQRGGRLVQRIGKPKHYAQSVKNIGFRLRGRVSGTPVQPCGQRDRILSGRLNLMYAPEILREKDRGPSQGGPDVPAWDGRGGREGDQNSAPNAHLRLA